MHEANRFIHGANPVKVQDKDVSVKIELVVKRENKKEEHILAFKNTMYN